MGVALRVARLARARVARSLKVAIARLGVGLGSCSGWFAVAVGPGLPPPLRDIELISHIAQARVLIHVGEPEEELVPHHCSSCDILGEGGGGQRKEVL